MGSAPSIKDMQAKEDDFDAWVAKRTKAVVDECTTARELLLKLFREDVPESDDLPTLRDKYWADFTHDETFTLAAISNIIRKVTGALFGDPTASGDSTKQSEGGVDVAAPTLTPALVTNLASYANVEALIAAKALNLVAGILELFDTKASLKGTFQSGLEEISPGLYLAISARRTEYSGHDIFHDTTVIESYFVVVVKYSHKAFLAAQRMFDDADLANQLAALRANFGEKFEAKLAVTDPFDDKAMTALTDALDAHRKLLQHLEDLSNEPAAAKPPGGA